MKTVLTWLFVFALSTAFYGVDNSAYSCSTDWTALHKEMLAEVDHATAELISSTRVKDTSGKAARKMNATEINAFKAQREARKVEAEKKFQAIKAEADGRCK